MDKLIEISVKGSVYYFLNSLSYDQLTILQQFAKQFYTLNPVYNEETDDAIVEHFITAVQQTFGISLTKVSVAAVLVIK